MKADFDILIVSIFGRGHHAGLKAQALGMRVALLDLTATMGNWSVDDFEGPFGVFGLETHPDWNVRLSLDAEVINQAKGFVVWTKSGPFEFKGALSGFYLNELDRDVKNMQGFLGGFWGQCREHSLFEVAPPSEAEEPDRMRSGFAFRRLNFQDYLRGLEALKTKGLSVSNKSVLQDVSFSGGERSRDRGANVAIETTGEWVGITRAHSCLWMLTQEETAFLSKNAEKNIFSPFRHRKTLPNLFKSLFQSSSSEPVESCWIRYELSSMARSASCELGILTEPWDLKLPDFFCLLGAPDEIWARDNFIIFQRTLVQNTWSVWVKIPALQRFNSVYLRDLSYRILARIEERFALVSGSKLNSEPFFAIKEGPREMIYSYKELGPPRFPVYSPEKEVVDKRGSGFYFSSPEQWKSYSWESVMSHQENCLNQMSQWFLSKRSLA